jgi:hypothetical protein
MFLYAQRQINWPSIASNVLGVKTLEIYIFTATFVCDRFPLEVGEELTANKGMFG